MQIKAFDFYLIQLWNLCVFFRDFLLIWYSGQDR